MGGVELRAARLFNKESGRAFITAFDHGSTVGPRAGSEAAVEVMTAVRGAKTKAQKSLRWPVAALEISGSESARAALDPVMDDIIRAGNIISGGLQLTDGDAAEGHTFAIAVILAEDED